MKLVVASDAHLDHKSQGVARFDEVAGAMWLSAKAAMSSRADLYVFAGDLCDPDDAGDVLRATTVAISIAAALHREGISSLWVAGNHDVVETSKNEPTLSPIRGLWGLDGPSVLVAEVPALLELQGMPKVLALPYAPAARGYDVAKQVDLIREEKSAVCVAHMARIRGVSPSDESSDLARGREIELPVDALKERCSVIVNGHFHKRQVTPDGVQIPGSLARLTFGDEEKNRPSFLMIETSEV